MSELRTNRIVPRDGLPSGSSGGIIQVKSTTLTVPKQFNSGSAGNFTDVDGLSVSITPHRSDSKILLMVNISAGLNDTHGYNFYWRILRGSTQIYEVARSPWVNAASGAGQLMHMEYMDSPSTTSATTYKVQVKNASGGGNVTAHMGNSNAQVILMEIAQ